MNARLVVLLSKPRPRKQTLVGRYWAESWPFLAAYGIAIVIAVAGGAR